MNRKKIDMEWIGYNKLQQPDPELLLIYARDAYVAQFFLFCRFFFFFCC